MKRLILISLFLLFVNQLKAESVDIWGRLVYQDGHGVAGALVTLQDYYTKEIFYDTTDVNGYYSLGSASTAVSNSTSGKVSFNSFITNSVGRSCNFFFFDSIIIDKANIYNILGQKVSSIDLQNEYLANQQIWNNSGFWDGNSTSGFPVANGTYFITAKTTKGLKALKFVHNGFGQFTTPIPLSRIEQENYIKSTSFSEPYLANRDHEDESRLAYYFIKYEPLFGCDKFIVTDPFPEILFNDDVNSLVHTVEYEIQDSLEILFIGNSYTRVNGIDLYLSNLFLSANPTYTIDIQRSSYGGWSLEDHWYSDGTQTKLNGNPWDIVILQDFSSNPVNCPEKTYHYAQLFNDSIEELGAETAFYMTWAREFDPDMIISISTLYRSMGITMDALVSPVGLAWQKAMEENPNIDLYVEDGSHPTSYGTYLAACVFYSTLFHKSPEGIEFGSELMDSTTQNFLQHIAWVTVREFNRN